MTAALFNKLLREMTVKKFIKNHMWFLLWVAIGLLQVVVQMTARDVAAGLIVAAYALLGYWLQMGVNKFSCREG